MTDNFIDKKKIESLLPHREPMLLIDKLINIVHLKSATAVVNVKKTSFFVQGHFPGQPVMPGVLQLEAMAQAAGLLLLRRGSAEGKVAFFMSADKVKFRSPVVPGDQLEISAKLEKVRGDKLATASAECRVNGKVVSSAQLMFALADASEAS